MLQISVIVPVYNVEKYLHRCVDSILAQTFTDFELILVDDGSPDNCGAICDEYARKDARVWVIHKENGGVAAARNTGLEAAKGTYIVFVDSDDYVSAEYLEKLIAVEGDLVISGYYYCDSEGNPTSIARKEEDKIEPVTKNGIVRWFEYGSLYSVWSCRFTRRIIEDNHIRFDENTSRGEDTIFVFDYLSYCTTVSFIKDVLYYYVRYEDNTLTTRLSTESISSIGYLDAYLNQWFKKQGVRSLWFESMHIWTKGETKSVFLRIYGDSQLSIKQKYEFYRAFWRTEVFRNNIDQMFSEESIRFRNMLKRKTPLLLCIHEYVKRVKN